MTSEQLLQRLKDVVWTTPCPVVGCTRQHVLAGQEGQQEPLWRFLRGNTVLACLGARVELEGPWGPFHIWLTDDRWLLQFRGGRLQPWWIEDCKLLLALVMTYTTLKVEGCTLLQELDGKLQTHYIDCPSAAEKKELLDGALQRWEQQTRYVKNQPRALAACQHCPVRRECDLMDLARGETADWPGKRPGPFEWIEEK